MNWAVWEPATVCSGKVSPGAAALAAWLQETYPQSWSMGIYNCRTVRGGATKSLHGEGRAYDNGWPMDGNRPTASGYALAERLGEHGRRLGLQCIIYGRRIWSATSPAGRPYTGVHPHHDHHHIELNRAAARSLNLATLRSVLGDQRSSVTRPATDDLESTMREGDKGLAVQQIQHCLEAWDRKRSTPSAGGILPQWGADGDYGKETRQAVETYQRAVQLPITGVADGITVAFLLRHAS